MSRWDALDDEERNSVAPWENSSSRKSAVYTPRLLHMPDENYFGDAGEAPSANAVASLYAEREENRRLTHMLREKISTLRSIEGAVPAPSASGRTYPSSSSRTTPLTTPRGAGTTAAASGVLPSPRMGMNGHHQQSEPAPPAPASGHFFSFSIPSFLQGTAPLMSSSSAATAAATNPPIATIDEFRKWLVKEQGGRDNETGAEKQHRIELEAALGIAAELRQIQRELESALEEERRTRANRDVEIRDLRNDRERVIREYKNLEAELSKSSGAQSHATQHPNNAMEEAEIRRALAESKGTADQLREEVASLNKALSKERDLLRQAHERETKSFVHVRAAQAKEGAQIQSLLGLTADLTAERDAASRDAKKARDDLQETLAMSESTIEEANGLRSQLSGASHALERAEAAMKEANLEAGSLRLKVSRLETELGEAQERACEVRQEQKSAVTAMSELADARDAALREAARMNEEAEAIAAAYEVVTAESEARAGEVESAELRFKAAEARFKHEADAADTRIEEALAECERRRNEAEVLMDELEESGRELSDVRDMHAREIEALGREVEANRLVGEEVESELGRLREREREAAKRERGLQEELARERAVQGSQQKALEEAHRKELERIRAGEGLQQKGLEEAHRRRVAEVEKEGESLRMKIAELEEGGREGVDRLRVEMEGLRRELEEERDEHSRLKQLHNGKVSKLNEELKGASELEEAYEEAHRGLAQAKKAIVGLEKELAEANRSRQAAEKGKEEAKEKVEAMERGREEAEGRIRALEGELDQAKERAMELEARASTKGDAETSGAYESEAVSSELLDACRSLAAILGDVGSDDEARQQQRGVGVVVGRSSRGDGMLGVKSSEAGALLKAGDAILGVGGKDLGRLTTVEEATKMLMGPSGSAVRVSARRGETAFETTMIRGGAGSAKLMGADAEERVRSLVEEVASLKRKTQALSSEGDAVRAEAGLSKQAEAGLRDAVKTAEERARSMAQELEDAKEAWEGRKQAITRELEEARNLLKAEEKKLEAQKGEIASLAKENRALKEGAAEGDVSLRASLESLEAALVRERSNVKDLEGAVKTEKKRVEELDQEREGLRRSVANLEKERDGLRASVVNLEAAVEGGRRKASEIEEMMKKRVEAAVKRAEESEKGEREAKAAAEGARERCKVLEEEGDRAKGEGGKKVESVKAMYAKALEDLKKVQGSLEESEREVKALRKKVVDAEKSGDDANKGREDAERGRKEAKEELEKTEKLLRKTQEGLEELVRVEGELAKAKERVIAVEGKLEDSDRKLEETERKLSESSKKLKESEKKVEETEKKLSESSKKLKESEKKVEEAEKKSAEAERRVTDSEEKLSESSQRLGESGKEKDARIGELEKDMKESGRKAAEAERKMAELEKKLAESEEKGAETQGKLQEAEKKIKDADKHRVSSERDAKGEFEKLKGQLEREMGDLKGLLEQREAELDEAKSRQSSANASHARVAEELKQERRRLEESYERSGALAEEVAAATGALSEREEELAEARSQLRASRRDSLSPTKPPPASGQGNDGEEASGESGSEALGFLRRISASLSSAVAGGGGGGGVGVGIEVGKPPKTLPKGKSERAKAQAAAADAGLSGLILVTGLVPGTAGAECGRVSVGDVLVSVGGKSTTGMEVADVVELLHGAQGTSVVLKGRKGESGYEVTLQRGTGVVGGVEGANVSDVGDAGVRAADQVVREVVRLRLEVSRLEGVVEKAQAEAEEEREKAEEEVKGVRAERDEALAASGAKERDMSAKLSELEVEVAMSRSDLAAKKEEAASLEKKVSQVKAMYAKSLEELKESRAQVEEASKGGGASDEALASITKQLGERDADVRETMEKIEAKEQEMSLILSSLEALHAACMAASGSASKCGVGLVLGQNPKTKSVGVVEVVEGGSASKSGKILKQDQVTSIGGIEVGGASGASADRAMELLSGAPGSNVVVKGKRGGNTWSVELARGTGAGGRKGHAELRAEGCAAVEALAREARLLRESSEASERLLKAAKEAEDKANQALASAKESHKVAQSELSCAKHDLAECASGREELERKLADMTSRSEDLEARLVAAGSPVPMSPRNSALSPGLTSPRGAPQTSSSAPTVCPKCGTNLVMPPPPPKAPGAAGNMTTPAKRALPIGKPPVPGSSEKGGSVKGGEATPRGSEKGSFRGAVGLAGGSERGSVKGVDMDARSVASSTGSTPDLCGVGMRITDRQPHRVVALLDNAAAALSGQILVGDELLAVDGKDVKSRNIREVRRLITGQAGSEVVMEFKQMDGQRKKVTMHRGGANAPHYASAAK